MRLKKCARCFKEKPATLEYFLRHKLCKDGIGPYCRPCASVYARDWKRRNRDERSRKRREAYRLGYAERHKQLENLRGERFPLRFSAETLLKGVYERARNRGLPVAKELRTKEFIVSWFERQRHCECCGAEFLFGRKRGLMRGLLHDNSPSLDQIIPGAGYELSNVALICWRCNNIKRNYNENDLRMVASWIEHKSHSTTVAHMAAVSDALRGAA